MFTRICPQCSSNINYINKNSYSTALKKNTKCQKCRSLDSGFTQKYATKGKGVGRDNPFYGKKHTNESKEKIKNRDFTNYKTIEFREKISKICSGQNNPMYGKTYYEIWLKKYGKEKADKLQLLKKENNSRASKGKNNSMYGKPSPQGSGNGWTGWYKNYLFRSIKELSYIIKVIETNNWIWESAEIKKYTIKYISPTGSNRTYRPDFIINNKILVEVKPVKLHNTPTVLAKKKAAEEFCKTNNLEYQLVDCEYLSMLEIKELIYNGTIVFIPRYQKKFEEKYGNIGKGPTGFG